MTEDLGVLGVILHVLITALLGVNTWFLRRLDERLAKLETVMPAVVQKIGGIRWKP